MWKALYKSLKLVPPPKGKPFPLPRAADLDKVEKKLKLPLPASYRAFAQVFGVGQIGGYFRVGVPAKGAKLSDLLGLVEFVRGNEELYVDTYGDKAFVRRMLPFGTTLGGDILVWDPHAVSDTRANEYRIFVLPDDQVKIVPLADDFSQFITKAVFGPAFKKALKQKTWSIEKIFEPWGKETLRA
jgi:hypothetical protein